MNIGDMVRVERVPDGLPPDDKHLAALFQGCVGRTFPIINFDGDLVELHVGEVFGKPAKQHQIWLAPSQLTLIEA
ncbi:hypothetical protein DLM45_08230 [Hyphomicrobium methylovorum]|uniref:hypothetical protein n=1 Tax=Hyphomicrobium methylovorum TaxID=84 RepID=UPI0015E64A06|nr:hypothetical protein [Hyphomicrobium methylovorum]MBA2126208.1 hypothetical protein [Hyphomicrobium methylovorum]